jgi:dTDP-4-dehydrorhamnose reductase
VRIFVTGLGGYLGRAIAATHADTCGTVRSSPAPPGTRSFPVDVRDAASLSAALGDAAPDAIIHTAYIQYGPDAGSINVDGSRTVARAAHERGLRLVHLSSDVIFGGQLRRPIREDDLPSPVTDYGATKAAAEYAVLEQHPDSVLVRTSLIYGGAEPSRHEQLALDPEMTFFNDEIRCPVAAPDLASAVLELAARPDIHGPLNVAGADALSRYEFAQLVAKAHGHDPDAVRGKPRPTDRPGDLRLDCSRAMELLETRLRGAREVLG